MAAAVSSSSVRSAAVRDYGTTSKRRRVARISDEGANLPTRSVRSIRELLSATNVIDRRERRCAKTILFAPEALDPQPGFGIKEMRPLWPGGNFDPFTRTQRDSLTE